MFATKGARMPDGLLADILDLDRLVGPPSVTLYGKTAYVGAFDYVQAIDTTNGHATATIEPAGKALVEGDGTEHKAGAPAIVTIGGARALLTPFPVKRPVREPRLPIRQLRSTSATRTPPRCCGG